MGLLSRIIPNLFNGVSQQPPSLRHPSQSELVENAYPSVALGLGKRPPTEHVAKISNDLLDSAFVETLNRDSTERYSLVVTDGVLKVFDLVTGEAKTLNPSYSLDYITGITASDDLVVVTVADYSFVINKKKVVKMTQELFGRTAPGVTLTSISKLPPGPILSVFWEYIPGTVGEIGLETTSLSSYPVGAKFLFTDLEWGAEETPPRPTPELLNRVFTVTRTTYSGTGDWGTVRAVSPRFYGDGVYESYIIFASGGTVQNFVCRATTSTAHNLTASSFVRVKGATPDVYNATGPVLRIPSTTTFDYNAVEGQAVSPATGTFTYEVTQGFKGSKQKFSDLPTSGQSDGDMWKIEGDITQQRSRYYVMWSANQGVWVECADPTMFVAFDPSTMPHKLVREADGTFTFSEVEWEKRLVGDNKSNPIPSFVGRTIADVVFYRNRLGFLSDESTILSRSGNYFNFWGETATAVLDSDPIDVTAAHTKVSILNWAVAFNKALLLFSGQTQFQLASGEVLTPKTAKLETVSEFESSAKARPVAAGQNVFFTLDKGTYSTMREYFVDSDTYTNDAADITAHVPKYLPGGVRKLAASSSEDILIALSSEEPNVIYVYKFYWGATEKLQSAWVKWVWPEGDNILNFDLLTSSLYLTVQRSDGVYLEKMNLEQGAVDALLGYKVYLDRRITSTGVYNSTTNRTTWTLPYSDTSELSVVLGGGFDSAGAKVEVTRPTPTTVQAKGNYSTGEVFIGRPYTKRLRFSQQFLKDANNLSILTGRLQMRRMTVDYSRSGYFRVEVKPTGRDTFRYLFTGKRIGSGNFILGQTNIEDGQFAFPVNARSTEVQIELVNDSHLPSFFQSAEWFASFSSKTSSRVRA